MLSFFFVFGGSSYLSCPCFITNGIIGTGVPGISGFKMRCINVFLFERTHHLSEHVERTLWENDIWRGENQEPCGQELEEPRIERHARQIQQGREDEQLDDTGIERGLQTTC